MSVSRGCRNVHPHRPPTTRRLTTSRSSHPQLRARPRARAFSVRALRTRRLPREPRLQPGAHEIDAPSVHQRDPVGDPLDGRGLRRRPRSGRGITPRRPVRRRHRRHTPDDGRRDASDRSLGWRKGRGRAPLPDDDPNIAAGTPSRPARSTSPRPVSRATWQLLRVGTQLLFRDREINKLRRSCGLGPLRGNAGWAWAEADSTVILASSHYFGAEAPDWPPVTWGGFAIRSGAQPSLDSALSEYIDAGQPPVAVTLGTSAASGAGERFADRR